MDKIGRYEVERELGFGGMGEVYLARDPYINRQVAIKVLPRPKAQEAKQFRARFEREARIIATLEHPGIVPIHDFGYHEDQPYIVMRYMAGGTLKERIKDEPVSTTETIRIFRQLTPALDYIHRQGIIHRDLKPTNILFDLVGNAYVSNFGIAKISETSLDLTAGATIGTPEYMSPEQAQGKEELDRRSDVYSMGVVLYEMLSGKVPYQADTPMSRAMAHIIEPVPDITKLRSDLSWPYQTLLYKALEKDREERFGAVSDLFLALEKAEQDRQFDLPVTRESRKEETVVSVGLAPKPQQRQKIPQWAWMGGGVGAIIFVVMLGIFVSSNFSFPGFAPASPSPEATQAQTVTPTKTKPAETTSSPSRTPTPTMTPLPSQIVDEIGVPMVLVPAGEFQMGSNNGSNNEQPVHTVYLDDFYMDQYEVTNEQFARCVDANGCTHTIGDPYFNNSRYTQNPVVCVSWGQAQTYCEWRGARLPTEAEWEKAALGSLEGKTYPWGDDAPICKLGAVNGANFRSCSPDGTFPVGSFVPNGYGLYDMAGNVWEWIADWIDDGYYSTSPEVNPTGPESGSYRLLRGGSWYDDEHSLRSAYRHRFGPDDNDSRVGFRCARSP